MNSLHNHQVQQALLAVENEDIALLDKVEMLMQVAMGLQHKPKNAEQLFDAITLYNRALDLCPEEEKLLAARLRARKATALQMVPGEDTEYLELALKELETALPVIDSASKSDLALSTKEEVAEVEMNLGLVLQSLASHRKAKITDSIFWYQRALRTFTKDSYPSEFSILHNNLATAYLSIPLTDERAKMREALAVQSFEAALEVITIEDHPTEYAMLQNNLGNALQYASSSHAVENNLRALEAYREALRVRDIRTSPTSYANTISNMANCLRNLPDDLQHPENGNKARLLEAKDLYTEAREIFVGSHEFSKVEIIDRVIADISEELSNL